MRRVRSPNVSVVSKLLPYVYCLKQGDGLACLLLNTAVEKVLKYFVRSVQTIKAIFTKLFHLLAFVDDVDIAIRSYSSVIYEFLTSERGYK